MIFKATLTRQNLVLLLSLQAFKCSTFINAQEIEDAEIGSALDPHPDPNEEDHPHAKSRSQKDKFYVAGTVVAEALRSTPGHRG